MKTDPIDVLFVAGAFWQHRIERYCGVLDALGISNDWTMDNQAKCLAARLKNHQPKIVFAHTFSMPTAEIARVAECFPDVQFCIVCHSSSNHLFGKQAQEQTDALVVSERMANFWYATPESTARFEMLGYERFIRFPLTIPLPESYGPSIADVEPTTILVAGRADIVKSYPASLVAIGILARERPIKLIVAVKEGRRQIEPFIEISKLSNVEWVGWMNYADFDRMLRERVTLTIQPSLTESFNWVTVESMIAGRPAVGSAAIRFLPADWQADPNDPADIARIAREMLDDYMTASERACRIARSVCEQQLLDYEAMVCRLMDQ